MALNMRDGLCLVGAGCFYSELVRDLLLLLGAPISGYGVFSQHYPNAKCNTVVMQKPHPHASTNGRGFKSLETSSYVDIINELL